MNEAEDQTVQSRPLSLYFFMRHLAHELGNPVASIRMSAEMLLGDFPFEMQGELFQIIMSEAVRLETLIESAVYYAAIGTPNRQDLEVAALIDSALRQCEVSIPVEKDIRVQGDTISGDPSQISRLMRELISNAVDSHATALRIAVWKDDDVVTMQIEDNGEGIAAGKLGLVSDPFYTTRDGHLGLGLTIAKRITELHGGTIDIAPAKSGGTAVTVRLVSQSST